MLEKSLIDKKYMQLALKQAQKAISHGDVPVGAIIVRNGQVIAEACNMREVEQDATAHAEIIAIKQACDFLKTWRLSDCTMYVTLEPCPMCAGAIVLSRLRRLVYGVADAKMGAAESLFNIVDNKSLNHSVSVTAGLCEAECRAMLQEFFKQKR